MNPLRTLLVVMTFWAACTTPNRNLGPCQAESDAVLCAAAPACGPRTVVDRCGSQRDLDCPCAPGGCQPESDEMLCANTPACGLTPLVDSCGATRIVSCPCVATCGNGILDEGETCDGNCPVSCDDDDPCTLDIATGVPAKCNLACAHTSVASCGSSGNPPAPCLPYSCQSGDGCCPTGCSSLDDAECEPFCGNGVVEDGENCEGDCTAACDDDNVCTIDLAELANCILTCGHQAIVQCGSGDGCCPPGCDHATDTDCPDLCGNGVLDPGETCDGDCPDNCDDGDACTEDLVNDISPCHWLCGNGPIVTCIDGDGCCAPGCTAATDSDCL